MKMSTRGRYAVRLMMDLAEQRVISGEQALVKLKDIAERQEISKDYLMQLIFSMKNSNLVLSHVGKDGGFVLARPPEDITVLEIVEAAVGPTHIIPCLREGDSCGRAEECRARNMWNELNGIIRNYMKNITLDQMICDPIDIDNLIVLEKGLSCKTKTSAKKQTKTG